MRRKSDRPNWNVYFRLIMDAVSRRSTCLRRKVGCVFTSEDHHILATGYNGAPHGIQHCLTTGCLREELGVPSGERHELCRAVHAEQNAICQAAKHGTSLKDSIVYVSVAPCIICAKMLINVGIKKLFYFNGYGEQKGLLLLEEAQIETKRL